MPQRVATVRTVNKACRMIKENGSQGVSWAEDYRFYGRAALKGVLEERMTSSVDSYLEDLGEAVEEKIDATAATTGTC